MADTDTTTTTNPRQLPPITQYPTLSDIEQGIEKVPGAIENAAKSAPEAFQKIATFGGQPDTTNPNVNSPDVIKRISTLLQGHAPASTTDTGPKSPYAAPTNTNQLQPLLNKQVAPALSQLNSIISSQPVNSAFSA